MPQAEDARRHAPATERNRLPILALLHTVLPPTGTVLEIASGTGQHAAFWAPQLAPRHWLPSDPDAIARASIRSWAATSSYAALHDPLALDVTASAWPQQVQAWQAGAGAIAPPITALVNINMIHIAPWAACEGLLQGAEALLPATGVLYLYGPFKRAGQHTAPSNEAFDQSLRSQQSTWGVRDLEAVTDLAARHHFQLTQIEPMPANNFSVVFTRQSVPFVRKLK